MAGRGWISCEPYTVVLYCAMVLAPTRYCTLESKTLGRFDFPIPTAPNNPIGEVQWSEITVEIAQLRSQLLTGSCIAHRDYGSLIENIRNESNEFIVGQRWERDPVFHHIHFLLARSFFARSSAWRIFLSSCSCFFLNLRVCRLSSNVFIVPVRLERDFGRPPSGRFTPPAASHSFIWRFSLRLFRQLSHVRTNVPSVQKIASAKVSRQRFTDQGSGGGIMSDLSAVAAALVAASLAELTASATSASAGSTARVVTRRGLLDATIWGRVWRVGNRVIGERKHIWEHMTLATCAADYYHRPAQIANDATHGEIWKHRDASVSCPF